MGSRFHLDVLNTVNLALRHFKTRTLFLHTHISRRSIPLEPVGCIYIMDILHFIWILCSKFHRDDLISVDTDTNYYH